MSLSLRTVVFSDGERYPLLVDESGIPEWHATIFATTQIRNASKAPNTIKAALSAIRNLYSWAEARQINLNIRFARKSFLNEIEIDSLYAYTRRAVTEHEDFSKKSWVVKPINPRLKHETARADLTTTARQVTGQTHYIRLTYIANFLEWLAVRSVEQAFRQVDQATRQRIDKMSKKLRLLRPRIRGSSRLSARRGLPEEAQHPLLDLVHLGSEQNPFGESVQRRNQIIVSLLLNLGLRAGELLALKVSDFDFQRNELVIARRHGDKSDPRANQPVAKTYDRRLPLSNDLARLVSEYVLNDRYSIKSARRHEFLLVTHKAGPYFGSPLSMKGLDKVFGVIRNSLRDSLAELTPHVCSGQQKPDSKLSFFSATAGGSPSLNW